MKTRGNSGPILRRRPARGEGGFTLVEVLIAMAIIGVTAVVLLEQRVTVVQDAAKARDKRIVWVLASQKMAELELDKTLWTGLGGQNNGDFSEVDPEYGLFTWEYEIVREVVQTGSTPVNNQDESKRKELFHLTLTVRAPGLEEPVVLEGEFSTTPPAEPSDPNAAGAKPPDSAGQPPSGAGGPPK